MRKKNYKLLAERAIRLSYHHPIPVKCPSCGALGRHADKETLWCILCAEALEALQKPNTGA